MNSGVYKITNLVTNDFYIGSSIELKRRFSAHKRSLIKGTSSCTYLQNTWNKYGQDNFKFTIEAFCPKEYTRKLEQFFIDTFNPKYNIVTKVLEVNSRDRKVVNIDTNEQFNSIKEAAEKYNVSSSSIGDVCRGKGRFCCGYKWRYSDEKYKYTDDKHRKVICNETKVVYDNAQIAANDVGLITGSSILAVCKRYKGFFTAAGYTWNYIDDASIPPVEVKRKTTNKKILCVSTNKIYNSLTEAATDNKVSVSGISKAINKTKPIKNLIFKIIK